MLATEDDATCIFSSDLDGCATCSGETDGSGVIIDNDIDNDGVCDLDEIEGCTDVTACNFDDAPTTNTNNELCLYAIDNCEECSGETDGSGQVLLLDADSDGVCDADELEGCTNPIMDNYNPLATDDDGSCYREGCMSDWADNYDMLATIDDNSCSLLGCSEVWADNYNPLATNDDGSCIRMGCMDVEAFNFDPLATVDDASCVSITFGCMDSLADNYNPLANTIGSVGCQYTGCMDPNADNYWALSNISGDCIYLGCINDLACNYDPTANTDDLTCEFPQQYYDCDDLCLTDIDADGICDELEIYGCADDQAINYNDQATEDNNTCYYQIQVDFTVTNPTCVGGTGMLDLTIEGGLAPIEINTFGIDDLNFIPVGEDYIIHVSDASGMQTFVGPFDVVEPPYDLSVELDYNFDNQEITFETNALNYTHYWYYESQVLQSSDALLVPSDTGVYGVSVIDEYGCSEYVEVYVDGILDVDEHLLDELSIYPNPASEILNIEYKLSKSTSSVIRIFTLSGSLLKEHTVDHALFVKHKLPVHEFNAGVYLLEIEVDGSQFIRRVTVQ